MMSYKTTGRALLISATLLSSTSVLAQVAETDEAEASNAPQEIIVTAQRREQSLQEVPLAVSAFGAQELEARQVTDTLDLVNYGAIEPPDETCRIGARGIEDRLVIQGDIGSSVLAHLMDERGLSSTARSDDENHRRIGKRFLGAMFNKPFVHANPTFRKLEL